MALQGQVTNPKLMDVLQGETPIGEEYTMETISPSSITIVPILRSGLGMLEGWPGPVILEAAAR